MRFPFRSLRQRLSLRFFLLLAATFTLLGLGVYEALVWALHRDLETELRAKAENGARTVAAALDRWETDRASAGDEPENSLVRQGVLRTALLIAGRYAQLLEKGAGDVAASTPAIGTDYLPYPQSQVQAAINGQVSFAILEASGSSKIGTYNPGQEPMEAIFYPVHAVGGTWCLEVATPIMPVTEALQKVRLILLVITPVLLLIAWFAGSYLLSGILGRVDGMARAARRISARNLDERLPEHGPDEIGQLGDTFNEMLDRLGRSFDRMRRFTADASHELKTPLTSIRGDAEVGLMRRRSPEEYHHILQRVIEESERMSEVVDALLLLAQADARSVRLRQELVEVDDLVGEVVDACGSAARRADVIVHVDIPQGLLLLGDPVFLRQMLSNLVGNAIKYNRQGGQVWVRAVGEKSQVDLIVEDNGPGIPAEHRRLIFDRFYRVDSSHSSETGGSGLGLSIVRAIVDEHGGEIRVEEGVEGGARFVVTLPAPVAETDEDLDESLEPIELLL